ncbi:MAG: bifunctional serine/threonine-protein kinase/ABC transporter substrate-binding protein, partial [Chloroflexota bacterium]
MQSENLVGSEFGGIIIQERLSREPNASVYRGFDGENNRTLAVRLMRLNSVDNRDQLARFEAALSQLRGLESEHVQPLRAAGHEETHAYVGFDLLRGGNLEAILTAKPIMEFQAAVKIIREVAIGLTAAHDQGWAHLDLKPEAVRFDADGTAYLTDFGIARKVMGNDLISSREGLVWTPSYMSPEIITGDGPGPLSDVYSLAVMLYRMTTGHVPFRTDGQALEVIQRHISETPTAPQDHNPAIPRALENVILKGMSKDANARYATPVELAEAAEKALEGIYEGLDIPKAEAADLEALQIDEQPVISGTEQGPIAGGPLRTSIIALTALVIVGGLLFAAFFTEPPTVGAIVIGETTTAEALVPPVIFVRNTQGILGADGTIAYIACNRSSEFHAARAADMQEIADANGLRFAVYDSDSDPTREVANIISARADGARAMIVCLLNPETALPVLQEAIDDGVFVVLDSRELVGELDAVFVYTDNASMGRAAGTGAGTVAAELLDGAAPQVVVLDFPDLDAIVRRADGMVAGFTDVIPETEVVARVLGGTQDNGEASVAALLEDDTDFNVILSINDAGAYGAINAL